jgi:hypothetical protein
MKPATAGTTIIGRKSTVIGPARNSFRKSRARMSRARLVPTARTVTMTVRSPPEGASGSASQ